MRNKIDADDTVDARKQSLGRDEALVLAKTVKEIYSCKGNKVTHIHMWDDTPKEEKLLEALLGPTGNLRAPCIKLDNILLVGFSEEVYGKLFLSTGKTLEKVLK